MAEIIAGPWLLAPWHRTRRGPVMEREGWTVRVYHRKDGLFGLVIKSPDGGCGYARDRFDTEREAASYRDDELRAAMQYPLWPLLW
jgi:hypothetical protein